MFSLVSSLVIRHPRSVVLGWLVLAVGVHYLAPPWHSIIKDDDLGLFPADSPSVIGHALTQRGFPDDASSSDLVLIYERKNGRLTPDDFHFVDQEASSLSQFAQEHPEIGVNTIQTRRSPVIGPRLIGSRADRSDQAVLSIVSLDSGYISRKAQLTVERILEWLNSKQSDPPPGLTRMVTGSAAVGYDTNTATDESIQNTTIATIALVILILLVVYRSPLLAMVPLITIAFSVFASLRLIALIAAVPGLGFQVVDITQIFVIVVLFGAGTDYCLFLIARYREELGLGRSPVAALREAIEKVGAALFASAATVIVGLGMLAFSSFVTFQFTGPTVALSLAVALVAALTLAPALLNWLRAALFWPLQAPDGENRETEHREAIPLKGFWVRVADLVVRHPLKIMLACLAVLSPLAVVGARCRPTYSQLVDLDPDRPSVVGANVIELYFPVGELSPTVALIEHPTLDFRSPQGRAAVEEISRGLAAIGGIAEVRSLTRPVGKSQGSAPSESLLAQLADRVVRLRPRADMSPPGQGRRPIPITSPASKSFSAPIRSRKQVSKRCRKSERRYEAPLEPARPLKGRRDWACWCHFGGQRPQACDHQRPAPHVCPGDTRDLRGPGRALTPTWDQPLSRRHGGAGLPSLIGSDRLRISRTAPGSRAL